MIQPLESCNETEIPSKYSKEIQPLPLIPNSDVSKRKQSALEQTRKARVFSGKMKAKTSKRKEKRNPITKKRK